MSDPPISVNDGERFRAGDVIRVQSTGEKVEVTAVSVGYIGWRRARWWRRVVPWIAARTWHRKAA